MCKKTQCNITLTPEQLLFERENRGMPIKAMAKRLGVNLGVMHANLYFIRLSEKPVVAHDNFDIEAYSRKLLTI